MPNADKHDVFISYASRYAKWVKALDRNLGRFGVTTFLDQCDLGAGPSWVGQLESGIESSRKLLLVVTPESMASPRVGDELDAVIARWKHWRAAGRILMAVLVDAPVPVFPETVQRVTFEGVGTDGYFEGLRRLVAAIRGQTGGRNLPAAPDGLEPAPAIDVPVLPGPVRSQILEWVGPVLRANNLARRALESALHAERLMLEGFSTGELMANAALVKCVGADLPKVGARRFVELVHSELESAVPGMANGRVAIVESLDQLGPDSPEGPGLLGAYLSSVRDAHAELLPFFRERGGPDVLDQVYVEVALRPCESLCLDDASGCARKPISDARSIIGPCPLLDLLELSPQDHPWITRRWIVRGDPGSGKTTLLRHLAGQLAKKALPAETEPTGEPWIPLFDSLPAVIRSRSSLLERAEARLQRATERQGLAGALEAQGRAGRLLVLLDGLDEVEGHAREDAEDLIRSLQRRWPTTPIVVSSRPIGFTAPSAAFKVVDILPFDRDRRVAFLARWFHRADGSADKEIAETHVADLERSGLIWELAGNPLYLTLMALLWQDGQTPSKHRAQLYDQVFDLLLRGRHRPKRGDKDTEIPIRPAVEDALRRLAFGMTQDNRDHEPRGDLELRLVDDREARKTVNRLRSQWPGGLGEFLEDLGHRCAILGPHDGPDADWRFWHRSFREALTAQHMQAIHLDGGPAAFDKCLDHARAIAGHESRWAEPFALLAGRIDEPDALIRALAGTNPALALRALATAEQVHPDTVTKLVGLTGDWKERAKVFESLPEKVGDPERAIELLFRLAEQAVDGNDLYFIDAALAILATDPDHRSRAESCRARLFDHLPQPDSALFLEVPTRDGLRSLWVDVSKGEFRMGSPEGVGHSDEHPQHRVRFEHDLQVARTTVTNAQYANCWCDHTPHWKKGTPDERARSPVVNVTWYETVTFARWLSHRAPWARNARLPTEAEWEYACRGGTETLWSHGDDDKALTEFAWFDKNAGGHPRPVAQKRPNPLGLYDMHGNVWEWCADDQRTYDAECHSDPAEPTGAASRRVVRGGTYWYEADWLRSAFRIGRLPSIRLLRLGFRVVRPAPPPSLGA